MSGGARPQALRAAPVPPAPGAWGRLVLGGALLAGAGALCLFTLDFGFLAQRSGFQVSESIFAVDAAQPIWMALLAGLVNTLRVALFAAILAVGGGVLLALARNSPLGPVRLGAGALIEAIRNTPVLLQLFLWYGLATRFLPGPRQALEPLPGVFLCNRGLFLPWIEGGRLSVPRLSGFNFEGGLALSPELTVLLLGLALFHACYMAEIFRAGFRAVPAGQHDAAHALGLSRALAFRKVVLPQALGFALPPLAVQVLALVKNSSLAVAIGYPDLVAILATIVNRNGRALEGLVITVIVFLGLNAALGAAIEFCLTGLKARGALTVDPGLARGSASPASRTETLMALAAAALAAWPLILTFRWALLDATWSGPAEACRADAACWAVIAEKSRLLLVGLYPQGQEWRPLLALALVAILLSAICLDRLRHPRVVLGTLALALLSWLWLLGGGPGLAFVPSTAWGGIALTLGLAVAVIAFACLFAVPLALARLSSRPWASLPARGAIEIFRSVPLVSLLLAADLLVPLLLPPEAQPGKLWRAFLAIALLATVNLAEVLRGGLLSVPPGQTEAALALGLSRWQAVILVILPQAWRIALPAAVNVFVGAIKDTSLVLIVGILDVTGAAKAALADPVWRAYAPEIYLCLALAYFAICFPLARFARSLETHTSRDKADRKRSMSARSL